MQEWNKGFPGVSLGVYMAVICNTVEMSIQMKMLRLKKKKLGINPPFHFGQILDHTLH